MALLDVVDQDPLVEFARSLRPLLSGSRAEAEATSHMAPGVRKALGEAGLFRLAAPQEVGGHEARLATMAAVLHELAAADPGAAWHLANTPLAGLLAASMPVPVRERVFRNPEACYGSSVMPCGVAQPVEGGIELTGRWPFVTGIRDADWVVLAGMLQRGDEPPKPRDLRAFLVPASQVTVEDTWSGATALRSSGSNAIRTERLFVEDGYIHSFLQPRLIDRSLYRIAPVIVFTAAAAAIAIGVLRGALDATIATASSKRSSFDGSAWSNHPTVRTAVAQATAVHHCIRAGLLTVLDQLQDDYELTADVAPERRAIAWSTMYHATAQAREAVSSLAGPATSQAFFIGHPFEAAVRDIHAIAVSLEHMRSVEALAGGVLLGAPPDNPLF